MTNGDSIEVQLARISTDLKYLRQSVDIYVDTNERKCNACSDAIWTDINWLKRNQYKLIGALIVLQLLVMPVTLIILDNILL